MALGPDDLTPPPQALPTAPEKRPSSPDAANVDSVRREQIRQTAEITIIRQRVDDGLQMGEDRIHACEQLVADQQRQITELRGKLAAAQEDRDELRKLLQHQIDLLEGRGVARRPGSSKPPR